MASPCEIRVESVKLTKKGKNAAVSFDNEETVYLSIDLVAKYALTEGKTIISEQLSEIIAGQNLIDAKQAAYNFASYKPRTKQQVREKLRIKKFDTHTINKAIDFLFEFNLVDDNRYAKAFIKDFTARNPSGPPRIIAELRKRGIDRELAETSVSQYFPEDKISEFAMLAAQKKYRSLAGKPQEKARRSLTSYMQRQGFDWDTIKSTLEYILKKED